MVGNPDIVVVGSIAVVAGISYAAYWAFMIRRSLAIRLYRNQALGIFLIAVSGELVLLAEAPAFAYGVAQVLSGSSNAPLVAVTLGTTIAFELVLFYFVDASILAARRSDPLLRDTFAWRRLRLGLWPLFPSLIVLGQVLPFSNFQNPSAATFTLTGTLLIISPLVVVFFAGAIVLPVAAFRSRDATFRRSLAWFVFFVAALFPSSASTFIVAPRNAQGIIQVGGSSLAVTYLVGVFAAYFLYRSVKSLVPLNKLERDSLT